MPECDNCHAERNPLIHVQDMARLTNPTPTPELEAKWCLPCLFKAAIEQCGGPDKW
jgi:hypothetical protein